MLQSLETYKARCRDFGADYTALAHDLSVHAVLMEQLDWRVGRVAEAFRQADRAQGPVAPGVVLSTEEAVAAARERIEPQTEELVPEGGLDGGDLAILIADLAGIADPTPISDGVSGLLSLFKGDWTGVGLSIAAMVPYAGDLSKFAKWAAKFRKSFEGLKHLDDAALFNMLKPFGINEIKDLPKLGNPQTLSRVQNALSTLNRVHSDAQKAYENGGWLQKAKDLKLPTEGPVAFVPPKNWDPNRPLKARAQNGRMGFVDRYGNVWPFDRSKREWDVQRPKDKPNASSPLVERLSKDGRHVNVGTDGRITH
ncbi:MAG: polymorphic toxin type 17 domain-containing protein [Egibacteraceae bacterium]